MEDIHYSLIINESLFLKWYLHHLKLKNREKDFNASIV